MRVIIEIPGCGFRIKGTAIDWQVQYPNSRKDGKGDGFTGKYFFSTLDGAVEKAYELALRESPSKGDLKKALAECRRVKSELANDVRKAVAE